VSGIDDGSASREVTAALSARAAGQLRLPHLVGALSRSRLLVPLVEVAGKDLPQSDLDPCAGLDRAMAVVSGVDGQGAHVGLAFTGLAPMALWNPDARPLPKPAREVAQSVLEAGGRTLVIDSGSRHACPVVGIGLLRLAGSEPWPDPWADPFVRQALAAELGEALARGLAIRLAQPPAGSEADLQVVIRSGAGTTWDPRSIAGRLAASQLFASVFDGLVVVVSDDPQDASPLTGPVSFSPGPLPGGSG
jgi:hypothetical protein